MARNYSSLTLKRLFLTSGHYCAFPRCDAAIVKFTDGDPVVLGEIAHIEGSSDDGPRPNSSLSPQGRDNFSNLIVLCGHHHILVDKDDSAYPVEMLKEWKTATERATTERLSLGAASISFAELEIVCNAFADGDTTLDSTPMVAVPPQDKMDANSLTSAIRATMVIGLAQAPQVANYISRQAQLSSRFPERIRGGFVCEYDRLWNEGTRGDGLFFALIEFGASSATAPETDIARLFVIRAAAAAVLCHLFEICDVFEAPA